MTIELTPERALELMREVVAEYGEDHEYDPLQLPNGATACVYVHEGAPSCLVGHVLHRAGIPLDVMGAHENMGPAHPNFLRATGITEQVALPLAAAQDVEDEGMTWGQALAAAEARYAWLNEES